jgi:nitroreductase
MNVNGRTAEYPIDPLFLERWSPRAFTGEPIPHETLLTMLEAARWAASSFNAQPWRFIYAIRDTPPWGSLLSLLVPFNQEWAKHASALVFAVSKTRSRSRKTGEEHPLPTHSFDTGAACGFMVLQALKLGWHAHGRLRSRRGSHDAICSEKRPLVDEFIKWLERIIPLQLVT